MLTIRTPFFAALALAALATAARAERPYLAWAQAYDRDDTTASQRSVGVVMDGSGNVIVTGYRNESGGGDSWYTAKYDSLTGALIWEDTYDAPVGDARPFAIAIDDDGNPVVTGYTNTTVGGHDFFTIKYSAAGNPNGTGDREWTRIYNNPQDGADEALALAIDASGNVIVTGRSQGSGTQADVQTFKYAAANGADLWTAAGRRFSTSFVDEPRDVAVDPAGNVAVTGFSRAVGGNDRCYYTAKYAAADGAVIWDETRDDIAGDDDDAATSVVMDAAGQVIVTGVALNPSSSDYVFHTIAYKSALNATQILWQRTYASPGGNNLDQTPIGQSPEHFSPYLGIDGAGDPIIAGTSVIDGKTIVFYVAKYDSSANGATLWEKQSAESSDDFVEHNVNGLVVDAAGNAIVTGYTEFDFEQTVDRGYYTVKFDGADGAILWAERLDGARFHGSDEAFGVAVDPGGNVAVVGFAKKPDLQSGQSNNTFEILTVKYNRFLLVVGDPIKGAGLTDAAVISSLNPAAVADTGAIAARVGIKNGTKKLAAIVAQSSAGGNSVAALQGATEPGGSGGAYKSFLDPVVAPDGSVAFIGKLSGVLAAESTCVWTSAFTGNGTLQRVLQTGKEVPGLGQGTLLKSIASISLRNGYLAALITVKGALNATVLLGMSSASTGFDLVHTGETIVVDGAPASLVKKLSVYVPPKTSPGHGRYHGDSRLAALATLADKRTVFLNITEGNVVTPLVATGGDATAVVAGGKWKGFGPAGVASNGFNFCTLATLQKIPGTVVATDDTALIYSTTGATVGMLAREGGAADDVAGAIYSSFSDPVSAPGSHYSFIGTIKGDGIVAAKKTGIWWGTPGNLDLVVRAGDPVPDGAGNDTEATFKLFKNLALPTGGPIFLGSTSGKQNFGLWGVDSAGRTRQLLRNGAAIDAFGNFVVKKFVTLNSVRGALSASRSFSNTGGVTALVTFAKKPQAIVFIGIP